MFKFVNSSDFLVCFIAVQFFCCSAQKQEPLQNGSIPKQENTSKKYISKIEVSYVNVDITTPFRILCNDFKESFGSQVKYITISDEELLEEISNKINSLDINQKSNRPDVRIKAQIYYSDSTSVSLCMDGGRFLELDSVQTIDNTGLTDVFLELLARQ